MPLRNLARLAIAVLASIAEVGLAAAVGADPAQVGAALVAHGVIAMALLALAWLQHRAGHGDRQFVLFAIATAALGPLGALGALLAQLLEAMFSRNATSFDQWHASLFPVPEVDPIRALYGRIVLRRGGPGELSSVASFSDVMTHGTVEQKQTVVTLIADQFRPNLASALRMALNDPEPAIRVQAATASAIIENRFLERAMALEAERSKHPDDAALHRRLAEHHDEYAGTGLLDADRATTARRLALEHYEHCAHLQPGDPDVAKAIGRLLIRLGRYEDARVRLESFIEGSPGVDISLLAWYVESLYRLGRWDPLRALCQRFGPQIVESTAVSEEFRRAAGLWAGVDRRPHERAAV